MVSLDALLDAGDRSRDESREAARRILAGLRAGLYWSGWLAVKLVLLAVMGVAGVLYGVGWVAARGVWPALVWASAAVTEGWNDGRRPRTA